MGNLIDIDRLCDDLVKRWSIADKKKEDLIRAVMADVVTPIVVSQPTVDAVPVVHGRWEEDVYNEDSFWRCTACGFASEAHAANLLYKFCPNCGAKMDGLERTGTDKNGQEDGDHAEGTIQKERS